MRRLDPEAYPETRRGMNPAASTATRGGVAS
jgi:hypothetical protein